MSGENTNREAPATYMAEVEEILLVVEVVEPKLNIEPSVLVEASPFFEGVDEMRFVFAQLLAGGETWGVGLPSW